MAAQRPSMSERSPLTFAASGEHLVSGGSKGVRLWDVEDGHLMKTINISEHVRCVAFSKDSKRFAAGTFEGTVMIWDTPVVNGDCNITWRIDDVIRGVDFSDDGTRLITLGDSAVIAWNITTRERIVRLRPTEAIAAKYSPESDKIAVATRKSVQVYHSTNGNRPSSEISFPITANQFNTCLVWSNQHIFVLADSMIKQLDTSTGSLALVSEWPVPNSTNDSCISIHKHGDFIACSANGTGASIVTFWHTLTRTRLGHLHYPSYIHSIALSPDGRFLALGGENEKIAIKRLSRIAEPDFKIDPVALASWKRDNFADVRTRLSTVITSGNAQHHDVFASRSLVLSRLKEWDQAILNAEKSIEIQPSVFGYVAKSIALVTKGDNYAAFRACDIAFEYCHPSNVAFLLLIKAIVIAMAGEHNDAISRVGELIHTLHLHSVCFVVQERAYMYVLLGESLMKRRDFEGAIQSFERTRSLLGDHTNRALSVVSLITGWKFDDLDITTRLHLCKASYALGQEREAGQALLDIVRDVQEEVYMRGPIADQISDLLHQYLSVRRDTVCAILRDSRGSNVPTRRTTLDSQSLGLLLEVWAKSNLARGSWKTALLAASDFMAPKVVIYRIICRQLVKLNEVTHATECFREMRDELEGVMNIPEQAEWILGFKGELCRELERRGDKAQKHDEAIFEYSAALSLDPLLPQGVLVKRSKAFVAMGEWDKSLMDAEKVIELDPSSPWGYERRHAALHGLRRFEEAIAAFEMMHVKISQSSDEEIKSCLKDYVNPVDTSAAIRKVVADTVRKSPRVLIHIASGRLLDRTNQGLLFETLEVFKELTSSMTTRIDLNYIQREVSHYYRYATFSHTWEPNEPLFETVTRIVVHLLEESFTHNKLQNFCRIAQEAGLVWAWSDTCCINKADHFLLQEALVSMFKWYEGSEVTIVFLRGVHSFSPWGALMMSFWNKRAWTFQEYHASKVVRFYTEEWTPYLNLDIPNHKNSPEIILEMERATGLSAQALRALHPGLHGIREKLSLASERGATLAEDAAYSLLGIFNVVSLPIVYGEGDQALGRLLAQILTSSGHTSILAWTGKSGSFNSCLPAEITVFKTLANSHIPPLQTATGQEVNTSGRRPSLSNISSAMDLYKRLAELSVASFANQRMKLPCLTFKLVQVENVSRRMFRATTEGLGVVKIQAKEDLCQLDSLILIHPWIDFLLERRSVSYATGTDTESIDYVSSSTINPSTSPEPSEATESPRPRRTLETLSLLKRFGTGKVVTSRTDKETKALQFVERLGEPFGALLLARTRTNVEEYRRIASETLIVVQMEELTSTMLKKLQQSVCVLDVL